MTSSDTSNPIIIGPPGPHTATVIWLHGLGADGNDFVPVVPELHLTTNHGIKFIFPHAPKRPVTINAGYVMRAWYDIRHTSIDQREDAPGVAASAEHINALVSAEIEAGIKPERIALAGFSQGGAIALYCGLRYNRPLGLIIALSTYLPLANTTASESTTESRSTPILMCHGTSDPIVSILLGRESSSSLKKLGYQVDWHEYLMDHSVCPEEIDAISVALHKYFG